MLLPDAARVVLQKPLVVRMAVNDPNGYPHVVPVWFGLDGDDLMIFGFYNTRKIDYIQTNTKGSVQIGGDYGNDGYLLKGEYTPSFPLRLMHKDLSLALELGNQIGVALPAAAAARETYSYVKGASKEDLDYSAVMKFWQR